MQYQDHIPAYSHHKPSGQAVVRLNGRDHYLGPHGTAASRAEYNRLIGEWMAGGRRLPSAPEISITINEILLSYKGHVEQYYRRPMGVPPTKSVTSSTPCVR